jgi:hypothetical protein
MNSNLFLKWLEHQFYEDGFFSLIKTGEVIGAIGAIAGVLIFKPWNWHIKRKKDKVSPADASQLARIIQTTILQVDTVRNGDCVWIRMDNPSPIATAHNIGLYLDDVIHTEYPACVQSDEPYEIADLKPNCWDARQFAWSFRAYPSRITVK